MSKVPIIRAAVTFLSHEEGGRKLIGDMFSGSYMPHIVIQPANVRVPKTVNGNIIVDEYLGVRFILGPSVLRHGCPVECEMELMYYPDVDYGAVTENATFTLREGGRVVGFGTVTKR